MLGTCYSLKLCGKSTEKKEIGRNVVSQCRHNIGALCSECCHNIVKLYNFQQCHNVATMFQTNAISQSSHSIQATLPPHCLNAVKLCNFQHCNTATTFAECSVNIVVQPKYSVTTMMIQCWNNVVFNITTALLQHGRKTHQKSVI